MAAYYNEIDQYAAYWLRNLIKKGLIADGEVDERSIADVDAGDLAGFKQCHFFAGIAGWSYALRLAGWPDDRPVWTGSCPCQPFSVAGKGRGTDDERHLWPAFHRLIRECRPAIVFGEQVASRAGREWLSGVLSDLEGVGYAGAGADLCAPGVGAPHIRQRLYWVATDMAHANMREPKQFEGDRARPGQAVGGRSCAQSSGRGQLVSGPRGDMANAERDGAGHFSGEIADEGRQPMDAGPESLRRGDGAGLSGWPDARNQSDMADADCGRWQPGEPARSIQECLPESGGNKFHDMADANDERPQGVGSNHYPAGWQGQDIPQAGLCNGTGFWSDSEWRRGADGKERRVKPGVCLLVNGVPNRVGRLRGYGNAIVPQVAAAFIAAAT